MRVWALNNSFRKFQLVRFNQFFFLLFFFLMIDEIKVLKFSENFPMNFF